MTTANPLCIDTAASMRSARGNLLLESVPRAELAATIGSMALVALTEKQVLYQQDVAQPVVFFPVSGIVAFEYVMANGDTAEVGRAGNDGLISLAAVHGETAAANRAIVQIPGQAWSISSRTLRSALKTATGFRRVLDQYTLAFLAQVSQTAICNQHHSTRQRLARWLLHTLDRLPDQHVPMTQSDLADILGVRREAVSHEATKLRHEGAVTYLRGRLSVTNRAAVEAASCECYAVVVRQATVFLSPTARGHARVTS